MEIWMKISCVLCVFGFLRGIRPSEFYFFDFLIGEWRNLTKEQVQEEVLPVATYSYIAHLVVVFLITDLCRYKPLMIVSGCAGIAVWGMALWTKTLTELQILQIAPLTLYCVNCSIMHRLIIHFLVGRFVVKRRYKVNQIQFDLVTESTDILQEPAALLTFTTSRKLN